MPTQVDAEAHGVVVKHDNFRFFMYPSDKRTDVP